MQLSALKGKTASKGTDLMFYNGTSTYRGQFFPCAKRNSI